MLRKILARILFCLPVLISGSEVYAQQLPDALRPIGNLPEPLDFFIPHYRDLTPPYKWSGFIANPTIDYQTANFNGRGGKALKDAQGITLGAEGAYNFQYDRIVFGPAADLSYSFMDGKGNVLAFLGTKTRIGALGSIRGRLGYTFDRILIYATGGYAFADVNVRSAFNDDSHILSGWTAGGGIEYLWSETSLLRLEYRRISLGREDFRNLPLGRTRVGLDIDRVDIGFQRKF